MNTNFEPKETFDYAQKFKRARDEWLKRNPHLALKEFKDLPEPDRWGLPPEGTPLTMLPPPYNRHDWWKFKMLEWAGKEVSHMLIYNMPNDWERINSEHLEFVPSYQSYLDMCKTFDESLTRVVKIDSKLRHRGFRGAGSMEAYINYSKRHPQPHRSIYHYIKAVVMAGVMINDGEKFDSKDLEIFPSTLLDLLVEQAKYWINLENKYRVEFEHDEW